MMQKFSELPYTRPDVAAAVEQYEVLRKALSSAETYAQAREAFRKAEALETELSTAESIASIRNTMDTTDAFYDAEVAYFNENLPALIPVTKAFTEAIVNGPFRADFEREYGAHFIRPLENSLLVQDARIIGDLARESELSVAYSKAAAACKTEFRGETCNF